MSRPKRPKTWLQNEQGYELALRVGPKFGIPVELQCLIWADVTKNYYSRGSVFDRAASVLQAAVRRLMAIIKIPDNADNVDEDYLRSTYWMVTRFQSAFKRLQLFKATRQELFGANYWISN